MITLFWDQSTPTIASVLWPTVAGLILASFLVLLHKKIIGKLVKKLLTEKADTEETAKSLTDLGLGKSRLLRHALRDGTTLRKVVYRADGDGEPRYFIPEEKAYRAEVIYHPDGASLLTVILSVALILIVASVALILAPDLIQMFKNALSAF